MTSWGYSVVDAPKGTSHRSLSVLVPLAMAISLLWAVPALADLAEPSASDRRIALWVTSELRNEHLLRHPMDDEISQRAFKMYLEQLDPLKSYFLKSDIDEFRAVETRLDDMVRSGDLNAAYTIFKRYLQRVDQTVPWIDELLAMDHDFSLQEELPTDPDTMEYAADAAALKDRWRRRIKYELLRERYDAMQDAKDAKSKQDAQASIQPATPSTTQPATPAAAPASAEEQLAAAKAKIAKRYRSVVKRKHLTDADELLELFLSCVTASFDPHTSYMSKSTLENFDITMRLDLEGIGAALKSDDGYTVVSSVIPGGPADKMGNLKPEDRIVTVGQGTQGEMVDVQDMKLDDVVKLIRGHAGTVVSLGVIPAGQTDKVVYTFTRARVELKDSEASSTVIEDGKKADGSPYRLGVIDLPSFYMDMEGARQGIRDYKSTTRDVRAILEKFTSQGVDAVVLDLRRNGGGSLTEAISLTGLFIDRGPVVQVRDSNGLVQRHNDMEPGVAWSGPLVVLIGKFSASASEILAGAIQDYQRGVIVGDTSTHGKGTVQSMIELGSKLFQVPDPPNLGALKITIQQFYRPNGESTQRRGVLSDVVLPSFTTHMPVGEDDLDYPVEFDKVPSAPFRKYNLVPADVVAQMKILSAERVQASSEFQKLQANIAKYLEQKELKKVTLNEAEYAKQREEMDADREDEKQFENQMEHSTREVFERDFYNNEVLAVTEDYLRLLNGRQIAQLPANSATSDN